MSLDWLWKFILRKAARAQGFIDPFKVIGQLQNFAQPSEVAAPIELLRLSSVLQVRGLINAQAIQHNLDWIWPYWVRKQFDPKDDAFVARAFSMTHINLTHRNWTAVGIPEFKKLPIVDPAGCLTPFYDGWSLDTWVVKSNEDALIPSRTDNLKQDFLFDQGITIQTKTFDATKSLELASWASLKNSEVVCHLKARGLSKEDGALLVVSLRPMNPEGVSFINDIEWLADENALRVNKKQKVFFKTQPKKVIFSNYKQGDVFRKIFSEQDELLEHGKTGMVTAAVVFDLQGGIEKEINVEVPLGQVEENSLLNRFSWKDKIKNTCSLNIPDKQFEFLFNAATRSLILHAQGGDVYPGPYTYKHFWFRDAAFILNALLVSGMHEKTKEVIDTFPSRQTAFGHFLSQDGEWDSNGQALWMIQRYCEITGEKPAKEWRHAIMKGTRWIQKKRLSEDAPEIHAGLFPAGFSAEHLGPNDYYYWDDFWGVQGLKSAAFLFEQMGEESKVDVLKEEANSFMNCIEKSLEVVADRISSKAMPSSPHRRLDTGSIGSIAVGYPMQLWEKDDERLMKTIDYLLDNHFVKGGFFHDMSHSGINAYLTLEMAQVLLRAEDPRYFQLMSSIANLATSTGQWPEAIHPRTHGGCMGDGQHIWAAAEWVLMLRNCFVLEEEDELVLCAGVPLEWLHKKEPMRFGPTWTKFGTIEVFVKFENDKPVVSWKGHWREAEPEIKVKLPELV